MTKADQSSIRHPESHCIDTVRDDHSSRREALMHTSMIGRPPSTEQRPDAGDSGRYFPPMTTSAQAVIDAITERRPDQTGARLHLLLFFAQGHFLASTGAPLFAEPIYATATGVHIDLEPADPAGDAMGNRQLGHLGHTLHRYADMTDADLLSLVKVSSAWQLAIRSDDTQISWAWLNDWFRRPAELAGKPTAEDVAEVAAFRKARAAG
ncbi:hypothetical protein ACWKSP_22410 [Micromonosporaceae bacterium Da 78-11]